MVVDLDVFLQENSRTNRYGNASPLPCVFLCEYLFPLISICRDGNEW